MINESNKIIEETNLQKIGNLIKIPYYDLIEETKTQPSFYINGFPIIELDETNQDLYQDEENLDIEIKKYFQLKRKAFFIENYYMNYSEDELLSVHCSKCFMNGFNKNELLYFKDRKSLISYLKYCFIFLKKNLFVDHTIYVNNRYDLLKIDHTYFIGFHFLIPKTLCKSCFIQLINKEFLLSKLKNEISDTDGENNSNVSSPKKSNSLLSKKRKIKKKNIENKNSEKEEKIEINEIKMEKSNLKSIQITPIIIPISNPSTPKKKLKKKNIGKFTKIKIKKNDTKCNKYNDNVIYDEINNILIIKKNISFDKINEPVEEKSFEKLIIEKKIIEKKNIEKKNNDINDEQKILKEKNKLEILKNEDVHKQKKTNNINITKENENPLENSNNKAEKKDKLSESKESNEKDIPIINTKINNSKEIKENLMNKPNFIKKNTKINNTNINSNMHNNNNNINNNNNVYNINKEIYLFHTIEQFIAKNFYLHQQKIQEDLDFFLKYFEQLYLFSKGFYKFLNDNSIFAILNIIISKLLSFYKVLKEIDEKIHENIILMEYSIYNIKKFIQLYLPPNAINEQRYIYEFFFCRQSIKETQDKYKMLTGFCFEGIDYLIQSVEEMNKYYLASFANVQNA